MRTKTKAAYEFLFANLRSKWEELKLAPKVSRLLVDFEEAEVAAAQAVFGKDKVTILIFHFEINLFFHCFLQVRGCLFHFTKCVLFNVKQNGLWRYYLEKFGEENAIRKWIRKICALPLLPQGV